MKLTNEDILMAREPLKALAEIKLPVLVSYKLAKLVNKLSEQNDIIEQVRLGLVKKYGTPDERGQMNVLQDSADFEKFAEEFTELMSQETEIVYDRVKLPDNIEVEPRVLMPLLDKFIDV